MSVYYINLLLILGLAWPLCIYKSSKVKKAIYIAVCFGWMWVISTLRMGIGFDYATYLDIYKQYAAADGFGGALSLQWEPGFAILTKIMTFLVPVAENGYLYGANAIAVYGIYAALILIPVAWFVYRYCDTPWLSVWLFVTLAFFYTSLSFIRQSLACSVALLGYRFLLEKKPIHYMAVVLLAASFHKTALILIPIYFFCQLRLTPRMGAFYAAATVTLYLTSELIVNVVVERFYSYYANTQYITRGFPLVFLLVPFTLMGACLALLPVWRRRSPHADLLMNMMVYSSIIWLFITRHFILERFSMYVYMYAMVAVPAALCCLKASPETFEQLALAQEAGGGKHTKPRGKEEQHKLRKLAQTVSDHEKYYWSAVIAVLVLTMLYNEFGAFVNGFHNVFPYHSIFDVFYKARGWELGLPVHLLPPM